MLMVDYATFAVLDPEFFVPIERKAHGPEYQAVVTELLPAREWTVLPQGVWTHVHPHGWSGARQGWKLHVSATPENGAAVLRRVAAVLREDPAAFKFASDPVFLDLILAKNWPREAGGKFITIYPVDEEHFQRLGRALAEATTGLEGPYILSDRRVPGSRIVFYRYGEHEPIRTVAPEGHRVSHVVAPSGQKVSDRRRSYYQLPEWVEDPFGARPVSVLDSREKMVTLRDRYEVHGALKYSNTGGIYRGVDLERDQPVVIREARPCTGWIDPATDSVAVLRKQARILRELDGTGWVPRYVDSFQVWEHHYLVEEEVKGVPLRDYAMSRYLRPRKLGSPRRLFWTFRHVILELLRGIETFHRHGVILRDLTAGNVLVRPDRSLCFIDFEYAWERHGPDAPAAGIHTPGSASPRQLARQQPTEGDDFYALGAVVVELCSMMAPGLGLNPSGVLAATEIMLDEVALPRELTAIAKGLLDPDPSARWDTAAVRRVFGGIRAAAIPWSVRERGGNSAPVPQARAGGELGERISAACEELCEFFEASADPVSPDRLWPASPEAYLINPVCIQFGACGPIEYVRRVRGAVPGAWLDWVERMAVPERCPPGLYVGRAGVALTLAACGREEAARRLLLAAAEAPLLPGHAGLYHGAAGVGLAALTLGAAWEDSALTEVAVRTADDLERRAKRRRHGIAWRSESRAIPCGLAAGGSGMALFYTYLGACTGEERYWELAKRALEFEFSQVSWRAGYAFWPEAGATRRKRFRSPHVYFGSAGVGTATVRLYACTGDAELREWAERCARTLTFRWTNKLWQDFGYSGWGETLLDMHAVTGEDQYRDHALRMAEVLLPTQVKTRLGTAFPGGGLHRVASDFGMGASGVGLFLHRLVSPASRRAFFPDHLLPGLAALAPNALNVGRVPGTSGEGAAPRPAGRARARARARTPA